MDTYKDKIVQFFGGVNQYIGEMDPGPHPNGSNWYRILNPCCPNVESVGDGVRLSLTRIWGMDKLYKKYVDIYCPPDSLIEIRELDGGMLNMYKKELERPDMNLIKSPGDSEVSFIHSTRHDSPY